MGCDNDQYKTVCRNRFDVIEGKVDAVDRKLFRSNGDRALVEVVKDNTIGRKRIEKDIAAIRQSVAPDAESSSGIEISKKGIFLKGMKAGDMPKILLLVVILVYMVMRDHGPSFIKSAIKNEVTHERVEDR